MQFFIYACERVFLFGYFLKYFYIVVLVLLVGGVCLFNTFHQGQKLHAFFPRKCVLGFSLPFSFSLGGHGGDV